MSITANAHQCIDATIHRDIISQIAELEAERQVTVLWAIESGSRAWGFPSQDSDYDVRFIYAQQADCYLTPFKEADTINLPVDEVFDLAGWDLAKCYRLFESGNAVLQEWLCSPIVYQSQPVAALLKAHAEQFFQADKAYAHYYYLARRKLDELRVKPREKTFFYVLRPLYCCLWILGKQTAPPMRFQVMLELFGDDVETELLGLIERKAQGNEADVAELPFALTQYVDRVFAGLPEKLPHAMEPVRRADLAAAFRQALTLT